MLDLGDPDEKALAHIITMSAMTSFSERLISSFRPSGNYLEALNNLVASLSDVARKIFLAIALRSVWIELVVRVRLSA
jgi:hypothetical protein